jgi:hypothetical protein
MVNSCIIFFEIMQKKSSQADCPVVRTLICREIFAIRNTNLVLLPAVSNKQAPGGKRLPVF